MKQDKYNLKRLFIASKIEIDKGIIESIDSFKNFLSTEQVRWIEFSNIHLTYAFLGDTPISKIHEIISFISQIADKTSVFDLVIKSAGVFKNIQSPTIIWFGIEKNLGMNELKGLINVELEALHYKTDNRMFKPHITIGRLKTFHNKENLNELINSFQNRIISTQRISELILYESKLAPSGATYIPLFMGKFKYDDL